MSTLRANSIEHTDGGAITLTKQHALKAFACIDQTSSGHPTFESLNIASTTDDQAGVTTYAYTNNMSVTSHCVTLAENGWNFSGVAGGIVSDGQGPTNGKKSTSKCSSDNRQYSNANADKDDVSVMMAGDLA